MVCISRGDELFESQYCGGYCYDQYQNITLGKIYERLVLYTYIETDISLGYADYIIDDNNKIFMEMKLFMELKAYRKMKLEKIKNL